MKPHEAKTRYEQIQKLIMTKESSIEALQDEIDELGKEQLALFGEVTPAKKSKSIQRRESLMQEAATGKPTKATKTPPADITLEQINTVRGLLGTTEATATSSRSIRKDTGLDPAQVAMALRKLGAKHKGQSWWLEEAEKSAETASEPWSESQDNDKEI